MSKRYRNSTVQVISLVLLLVCASTSAFADDARWNELKQSIFGGAQINPGEGVLSIEAPRRAHDASTVPIVINSLDAKRPIKQVHLIVDKNPLPLAGVFRFTEEAGAWHSLETRIRINEYTDVRAVAELQDGGLYMVSSFVKAAGGCSAPALSDMEAAMARAGKMKLMIDEINKGDALASEAVLKISHPNNSGMQFDQVSRNYIPAFFVHTIGIDVDGKPLIEVDTNFSLSENPVVRLQYDKPESANDKDSVMTVYAADSKGNRYEHSVSLGSDIDADDSSSSVGAKN